MVILVFLFVHSSDTTQPVVGRAVLISVWPTLWLLLGQGQQPGTSSPGGAEPPCWRVTLYDNAGFSPFHALILSIVLELTQLPSVCLASKDHVTLPHPVLNSNCQIFFVQLRPLWRSLPNTFTLLSVHLSPCCSLTPLPLDWTFSCENTELLVCLCLFWCWLFCLSHPHTMDPDLVRCVKTDSSEDPALVTRPLRLRSVKKKKITFSYNKIPFRNTNDFHLKIYFRYSDILR